MPRPIHPLATARHQRNLTRAQLAAAVDCTELQLEAWEHGLHWPDPPVAVRLARRLQLSLAEVYTSLIEAETAAGRLPAGNHAPRPAPMRRVDVEAERAAGRFTQIPAPGPLALQEAH